MQAALQTYNTRAFPYVQSPIMFSQRRLDIPILQPQTSTVHISTIVEWRMARDMFTKEAYTSCHLVRYAAARYRWLWAA